jgi:hypothetical protein
MLGLLIEIWFTGIKSIAGGDLLASSHTYIWMFLVYGSTALVLEEIHGRVKRHFLIKAIIYVPVIYISEMAWGLAFRKFLGYCPWDYHGAGISVLNVIRLDYGFYWYLAALGFEWGCGKIEKLLRYVSMWI